MQYVEFKSKEEHRFRLDDGKLNGVYEVIKDDGSILKSIFKNGVKNGPENMTRGGRVVMQCNYKNGLRHGLYWEEKDEDPKIEYYVLGVKSSREEYLAYEN